jgi:hypothetical protein
VFSSRKLAQATYDSIAFRYICANTHPDHRTIADFRKRFLDELAALFTEVLLIVQAMGLVKLGTVSLNGTKLKANASKHKALSWEHANRLEAQLKGEVDDLVLRVHHRLKAPISARAARSSASASSSPPRPCSWKPRSTAKRPICTAGTEG